MDFVSIHSAGALLAAGLTYVTGLAVYRLQLHPLSGFPGPKLAALTWWYSAYYEIYRKGSMTDHLFELHKQYGNILSRPMYQAALINCLPPHKVLSCE